MADRLIQECGALEDREMKEQILDNMEIERERGITIKAQTVRLKYKHKDGNVFTLNLMDTPGHVDFAYEVSRSLSACEGSLLVVDSSQGVEAQTLANVYQAIEVDHEILTVLNKIDLPASDPDRIRKQINEVIKKFRIYVKINKSSPIDKDYLVDHSSLIFLLDKNDNYIKFFRPKELKGDIIFN